MSEQQCKQTQVVIKYLESSSDKEAASFSGLGLHHTRQCIADNLKQYSTLTEAPHPRLSPKYTEDVMKEAWAYLKDHPVDHFITPLLVSYLLREGILQEAVDDQNFRQHFEAWLHTQGLTLQVGWRKMVIEILPKGAAARLKFVREHLTLVDTPEKLKDIIIVDETTFEEGPHPKGKAIVGRQAKAITEIHSIHLQSLEYNTHQLTLHCKRISIQRGSSCNLYVAVCLHLVLICRSVGA